MPSSSLSRGMRGTCRSIGGLTSLRELQMRECKCIERLPDSIGNCVNLLDIGLSKCMGLT